jgi:hypothetical protein
LQRIPHVGEFSRIDSPTRFELRDTRARSHYPSARHRPCSPIAGAHLRASDSKEEWKVLELLAGGGVLCGVWGMLQYTRNRADAAERLAV